MKKWLTSEWKWVLVLFILAMPASLPLILPGFYEPHDLHHVADIYQMYRGFTSGQFPPRWAPDFLFNFGYPLFNFYYVLPFYIGAAFFALGFTLTVSFKLVFLFSVILSVVGIYLFLREFFGKWASVAGSVLFLYTPYRAVEIYVRGAMGEALALSILPFVLWILVKLIKKPTFKLAALASVILALFILAHNYLWFLSAPFIVALILLLLYRQKERKTALLTIIASGILALGLVSYWLIPALFERHLIDRLTPFLLIDHFPFIKQLILPSWGYGSSVWGPGDEISFQVGIVNWFIITLIVFVGIYNFAKKYRKMKLDSVFEILKLVVNNNKIALTIWALFGFAASLFMMNIRSLFIWKLIPFYNFIQFPWRLLIFTTILSVVLAACFVDLTDSVRFRTLQKWVAAIIIGTSILLTFSYFRPSNVFHKTDNEYLSRFFANRTIEGEKEIVTDEYLTWSEDYLLLPNWSDEKPKRLPESKIETTKGRGVVSNALKDGLLKYKVEVSARSPLDLTFNSLYFPGWYAKVDGVETKISPGKPYGQIELQVPSGKHSVEFFWKETPLRKLSNIISILSLIIAIWVFATPGITKKIISFWEKQIR